MFVLFSCLLISCKMPRLAVLLGRENDCIFPEFLTYVRYLLYWFGINLYSEFR